ncbi:fibronectin type III domain-containing [Chlorella sorokiniana]|uniref:Fibronectin type III domain-containing n=1 Tax=Chlorella sorokiniana TaxID=3076 RepID=A0A2P6TE56_CHLSO|nr:fibronectin type III domain-containing [Chlorella sorokiniana]|eukprot:PRW20926.1 fibronectin type III domain-containing [Chlorella sorokiniana]
MPGDITVGAPTYAPSTKAFTVTINRGFKNTATKYRYRVRKFTQPNDPTADDDKVQLTRDTPDPPTNVQASKDGNTGDTLTVTFDRAAQTTASSYRYTVKDATGQNVPGMVNLKATIADVTPGSLQFTTDTITGANQRYSVAVEACAGQGGLCSAGAPSNLAGVGVITFNTGIGWDADQNKIDLLFTQQVPNAESYSVTVYSRNVKNGPDKLVTTWNGIEKTPAVVSGTARRITISTTAAESPRWPGAGRYVFKIEAWNAAGATATPQFKMSSTSNEVIVATYCFYGIANFAGGTYPELTPTVVHFGDPAAPTGVQVTNTGKAETKITIEMNKPDADVHGGFVLRLKWLRGGEESDVTTANDGVNIYIARSDTLNVDTTGSTWKISFPISAMLCGGASCSDKGRFKVVAFAALSRFNAAGNFQTNYKLGAEVPMATADLNALPEIYYGNPDQPANLVITNTLRTPFDIPAADVAVQYEYKLHYFKAQGDVASAIEVKDTVDRSALGTGTVNRGGTNIPVYTLAINIAALDCDPGSGTVNCGAGSYQLKSFTAVTRVTGGQSPDATLGTNNNDLVIVEANNGVPEPPANVFVADTKFDATDAGDTVFYIEVDLPSPDNIQGWRYQLQYQPRRDTAAPVTVQSNGQAWIFAERAGLTPDSSAPTRRLKIPVPALSSLDCGAGNDCSAGGRFRLAQLESVSWFDAFGAAVTPPAIGAQSDPADTIYKSSWDQIFLVGSPSADPSGIRVPYVPLSSSDVSVFLSAPVADNAKVYKFWLQRINADETTDPAAGPKEFTVSSWTLRANNEFELTIPSSDMLGAGRYKLSAVAAVSSFDQAGALDRKTASNLNIIFIYGSPSEVTNFINNVNVPNVQTGPTIKVQITPPSADVALYYTVEVDYYSGKDVTPNPRTLAGVLAGTTLLQCTDIGAATTGLTHADGNSLAVRCPAGCAANTGNNRPVYTSAAGAYLSASSICRAAIHAGVISDTSGGAFRVTLRTGGTLPRTWLQTDPKSAGFTSDDYTGTALTTQTNLDMTFEALPTETNAFTVMRWGGTSSVATVEGTAPDQKLVLSIDLSQADCRTGGTDAQNKCGNGKYVVRQVKAFGWDNGGSYLSTSSGVGLASPRTAFTFVGDPETPQNVEGLSSSTSGSSVTIRFDRPEADTAKKYTFVLTKYFPGSSDVSPTCKGEFTMPDTTGGTKPGVDSQDSTKRTITVSLTPTSGTTGCSTLLGKYKVTDFKAVSWHGTAGDKTPLPALPSAYFYMGTVGGITANSVKPDNKADASAATSLTVNWKQTDPDAAKTASYELYRWLTGATSKGSSLCTTTGQADDTRMNTAQYTTIGSDTAYLRVENVALCAGAGNPLAAGRYTIQWSVSGNSGTAQTAESEFFYIGAPAAPATAPTVFNDAANGRLKVTFPTPTTDNAAVYKYELVRVANPSISVPNNAKSTDTTTDYTYVDDGLNAATGDSDNVFGTTTNTFYIPIATKALYRVRVGSVNPNSNNPAWSGWSDVIGTVNPDTPTVPSDVATNVAEGSSTLTVKLDKPAADVALYYTVEVDYYSGKDVTPNPRTLAGVLAGTTLLQCTDIGAATTGLTHADGNSLAVRCPAGCAANTGNNRPVYTSAAGAYLSASSICRAAIHAGVISDTSGGAFRVTLRTGGTLPRTWLQTDPKSAGFTSDDYTGTALTTQTNLDMTFEALPTETNAFTVMRWGGTSSVATVEGTAPDQKLVLSIDLSQADCRTGGTDAQNKCGNGKYVVRQVKAFGWDNGGSYLSTSSGVGLASPRTAFTFVGDPETPQNVEGLSSSTSGSSVTIRFDRPEADTAKKYTFVLTKYFPGSSDVSPTCKGEFTMPDTTGGTKPGVDSQDSTKRTITVSLTPTSGTTGCSTLLGKYKVTDFKAVSWHGTAGDKTPLPALPSAYFYMGTVGGITANSVKPDNKADASAATSLTVNWKQTDPDAAKTASYELYRWLTGATSKGSSLCTTTGQADDTRMNTAQYTTIGSDTAYLRVENVALCAGAGNPLAAGRYTIQWSVSGNSGTAQTAESEFFYIGAPAAPATAPAVFNDAANGRLKVTFPTPTTDNAEAYKYDLVRVANPSIDLTGATGTDLAAGYEYVKTAEATPTGGDNSYGATTNTIYISGTFLTDGLYRVRVKSTNPNGADALSPWSAVIGTGTIGPNLSSKKPSSVTVADGTNKLGVIFNLVAGATGYKYTVYTEESNTPLDGHENIEIKAPTITTIQWTGSTSAKFDLVAQTGAPLPAGRYTVAVAAKNTDATGADTWGDDQRATARAAVGTPTAPLNVVLANTPDGALPKVGSVTVTFTKPATDSGLEYWYALYRADTTEACYTSLGAKVASSDALLIADTKTFDLDNLGTGDYQVRVGVKNGLTTGSSSVAAKLCSTGATTTLDTSVVWSALSTAVIAVDNPGKPTAPPTVEYNFDASSLTVKFTAPATTRKYTYEVAMGSGGTKVAAGADVKDYTDTNPSGPAEFTISTTGWGPDSYTVTVYVQNAFTTGSGIASDPSTPVFVGTPAQVASNSIKLENKAGSSDTIVVKFAPPTPDIAQLAEAASAGTGGYRYTVEQRAAGGTWQSVSGKVDQATGTLGGSASERSFEISGLTTAGFYRLKLWGRIVHGNGKDAQNNPQTKEVKSTESTSDSDNLVNQVPHMRNGVIAIGSPGAPTVTLTGAVDGMTIGVTGITASTNANALQFKWVFLKDGVTNLNPSASGLTATYIDTSGTRKIDPLAAGYTGTFKVDLDEELCGLSRDSKCEAGTYQVGVAAVNGAGESSFTWTAVDTSGGTSIMGPPSKPQVSSMVVEAGTMDNLVASWTMPNTWTATSYTYRIWNTLDSSETAYTGTLTAGETPISQTVTGMGLYKVTVTAINSYTSTASDAKPDSGLVVGLPLAGGSLGLREVSVSRFPTADRTIEELSINFKDGLNSWAGTAGNCETYYEWEVVTSPGLQPFLFSPAPIHACGDSKCTGSAGSAARGCSVIRADISSLPDGRYQVFVVANNQFGYTRSAASNVVTVGSPTSTALAITPTDGDGQIGITLGSPAAAGPYRCQGKDAVGDAADWSFVKELAQGATTFTITTTDVPALSTTKQRWLVQCERADDWASLSAPAYASSGPPTAVAKPGLVEEPSKNGVKFTFQPSSPDAARFYVFVLKKGATEQATAQVAFDSPDIKAAAGGYLEYVWPSVPLSGSLTGIVRSINGVSPGTANSPESDATQVGSPGKLSKPAVQGGLNGFVVSFSPGTPSTATAYYYNVYREGVATPVNAAPLLANSATAAGASAPTTPSGGTAYSTYTSSGILSFSTGNLAAKAGLTLSAGFYQITVVAFNPDASSSPDLRYGVESDKSDLVALGRPGIPRDLTVTAVGWSKLQVSFTTPNPDSAAFYEYAVNNTQGVVRFNNPARVARSAALPSGGRVTFVTQDLPATAAYAQYQLRVTAIGGGNVISNWSTPVVAGLPAAPTPVTLSNPDASTLRVTFTAGALLVATDTFAYKLASIKGANVDASGQKYFDIALDSTGYAVLKAPAGGYYVEVMAARPLTSSGFDAGPASTRADNPAALGAPSTPTTAPTVGSITTGASPTATVQWAYADQYSTYASVAWRIKDSTGTVVATGSSSRTGLVTEAVSSPLSTTVSLKYTSGTSLGSPLQGRFTVQVCMANALAACDAASDSRWSPASSVFAAGTPTAPATVAITDGASSLSGAFTLPTNAAYDKLSYRLISVGQDGTGNTPLFGVGIWKDLSGSEISAGTITIPDPVVVGGTSIPVPTGRYRLDMRATANGADSSATSSPAPAYKGTPGVATAVSAMSGTTSIQLSFQGAEFATTYKVHVLNSDESPVMNGPSPVVAVLSGLSGSGSHIYPLTSTELGSPTGAATFKFKVESRNPNSPITGLLSSATANPVIYGKLAKPAKPELVWSDAAGSDPAFMELRFQGVPAPTGATPVVYQYQLVNATSGADIGTWPTISANDITGAGSSSDPYKLKLFPSPGRYRAKVRATTALSATANSDASDASDPEVMGLTSQPSVAVASGASAIATADDGATTVQLLVTLPSNNLNSGDSDPQLQLRMDTVEPSAAQGTWANVGASCPGTTAYCVESGTGTSTNQLVVKVTLTAANLPSPRRVAFVARTVSDNGNGAESAATSAVSVGRPKAPSSLTAAGSASGVEVTFTPDTPLSTDVFKYWAVDASSSGNGQGRLAEKDVSTWTAGAGGQRTFFVPFADFDGTDIPYIVTLKLKAANANGKKGPEASAAAVTVGTVIKPTGLTAVFSSGAATLTLSWQHTDTTVTGYDVRAISQTSGAVMTFPVSSGSGTALTVGGGVGQLPTGRWKFSVVAKNAVSQAESDPTNEVLAGTPGAPAITAVTGDNTGSAAISFTLAPDSLANAVRVSYAAVGSGSWTPVTPDFELTQGQTSVTAAGLPTGNWRFRLEAGNTASNAWSAPSSAWPATTVGLPGKPSIISTTGAKDAITLVVQQAVDSTATSFALKVHDASGSAINGYSAPLLSVAAADSNGRQQVVFGTDSTRLGGTYKFKVAAINSLGNGADSDLSSTAVPAYMPATPTGLSAEGSGTSAKLTFTPPAGAVAYEARALAPAGDSWAVTSASRFSPYAPCSLTPPITGCAGVQTSGPEHSLEVPLSALANLDGRYKFQVRGVDANGVPGDWCTESDAVTVGIPDAPRNLVPEAVRDIEMAETAASNVTLSFVPAWLAEQGYVIEVLDSQGQTLDTVSIPASSCAAKATAPV